LADDDDPDTVQLGDHPLFTQMDVLVHFADSTVGWKEISRSVKSFTSFTIKLYFAFIYNQNSTPLIDVSGSVTTDKWYVVWVVNNN